LSRWCREGTHRCLDSEVPSGATKGVAVEDNELRAYFARIDEQFAEVNHRITSEIGLVGVELEGLRAAMQLNNELIHAVDEKLEDFRAETKVNFKTVHEVIGASNAQLISRIRKLEKKAS
jgi:hypothetical protein